MFWFIVPDVHRFLAKHLESFGHLAKKTAFFSYKRKTVLLFGRLIHNHLIVK